MRAIAFRTREEGETAFPDLGTVDREIRRARGERLREEERVRRKAEYDALEEDRRLHPENYISMRDVLNTFNERRAQKDGGVAERESVA